ncbi:MAG: DUF86 domain-containing protein [Planctomycetes bacterium]|nr:DUF86 domain-containing protein [Planctomycetota bacterium]
MSALEPHERDLVKCEDMRIHAQRAREFLGTHTLDEFLDDELVQAAVIRCVEVIGEAARLVSEDTRRRAPEIPWRSSPGCATFSRTNTAPWFPTRSTRS